jgi:hypothetical protein
LVSLREEDDTDTDTGAAEDDDDGDDTTTEGEKAHAMRRMHVSSRVSGLQPHFSKSQKSPHF